MFFKMVEDSTDRSRLDSFILPWSRLSSKAWMAVLILVASGYLTLTGLDNAYFWDDEARTANIAKNFLTSGQLTNWDGRNLIAYRRGVYLRPGLKILHMTSHFPVTALSFRLFGVSTWAARFPFAIAGLATLFVFALILKEEFGTQSWLWVYALGSLALSVTFLLFIRQSRYFALSLLFSSFSYYVYRRCLRTRHIGWFILLAISSLALFYSNFLIGGAFLTSLVILHLIFHREDFTIKEWAKLALAVGIFASIAVPYAISHPIFYRPDLGGPPEPMIARKLMLLWWHLREIDRMYVLPWGVLALLALLFLLRRERKLLRVALEWATLGIVNVVVIALVSYQSTISPVRHAEARFLIASLPFFAGLTGILLWFIHQWKKPLALVLFVVLICSNVFSLHLFNPNTGFRWLLPAYIREIHNAYPTSISVVSDYLRTNSKQDELVYAYPEYFHGPLQFYLGDRIRICCLLDEQSPLSKEDLRKLDAPLFNDEHFPDWVIMFGSPRRAFNMLHYFSRPHLQGQNIVRSKYRLAKQLDVFWKQTQRPELPWHSFGPTTDFDRRFEGVYIYRRKGPFAR